MTVDQARLTLAAQALGRSCRARGVRVATAESCTGGGIAEAITRVPGASAWLEYGWVTYANVAKARCLGVSEGLLMRYGAVSAPVAEAMAQGARAAAGADWAVAVSGVAGPDGGTRDKPVGLVWFAWAGPDGGVVESQLFTGDREAIRAQTVHLALTRLAALIEAGGTPMAVP